MTGDEILEYDISDHEIPQPVAYLALFPRRQKAQDEAVRVWLVERYMQLYGKMPDARDLNGMIENCRRYIREGFWAKEADK